MYAVQGAPLKLMKHELGRVSEIETFLGKQGTFEIKTLSNGLFAAAGSSDATLEAMRYHYVWVRDNVNIAHCLYQLGRVDEAVQTLTALNRFFWHHNHRFLDIIDGRTDPGDAMSRPHIRFDGRTLQEVDEAWSHKQNDALGYFLWFSCKLLSTGELEPTPELLSTLALFPQFFNAIAYWQDADSGHWEETEAVRASSIGVALAGLVALRALLVQTSFAEAFVKEGVTTALLDRLCSLGQRALRDILPHESVQPGRERSCDAALLFLIYPAEIVDHATADLIINNVRNLLQGEIGIGDFGRDTFWAPDYKERVSQEERTGLLNESGVRNRVVVQPGEEAQWCLFDSILSIIYGERFLKQGRKGDLDLQIDYLNRALGQLTRPSDQFPPYRCPEAYYMARGHWVPNDATPLLWAQANLQLALRQAELSR